jgi:tetrahydromethanopterin S-methyltransferase subunit D
VPEAGGGLSRGRRIGPHRAADPARLARGDRPRAYVTTMRTEPWVWFVGGALAGVAGAAGASALFWALVWDSQSLAFPIALVVALGSTQLVRRSGSVAVARLWSAATWFGISGVLLYAAVLFLADRLPLAPLSTMQVIAFGGIWAGFAGLIAVGLFVVGRKVLARPPAD